MKKNLALLVLVVSLGATAPLAALLGCQGAITPLNFGIMATPAITLAPGTYAMPTSTTITDSFGFTNASIAWCYVTTGTCNPATLYTGSIAVVTSEIICANATASGYTQSITVCNSYTASTATPAIAVATGSYVMPQSTTVTDSTLGASILWCYAPTGNCTPATSYTGSIGVATSETICVTAMASGYAPSSTVCNSYTAQTATPAIALATGTYVMPQSTKITDSTSGAPILWCYTAAGSCTPATSYTASIYLNPASTETICANATASGYAQSSTACNSYTPAIANPVIGLATGTYVMPQNTPITDSTSGASILWCNATVGSCTPVTPYTAPVSLNPTSTETICAYATAPGYTQSSTVCNSYTAGIANPVITLASGAYTMPQTTTITDSTSGSSIMWCDTTTGSCTPATSYSASISLNPASTETICAFATAPGYAQSSTLCNSYVAGSYISFTYSGGQVTMSTLLQGAGIFYTLDGSTATEGSIEYIPGVPVTVAPGTPINAVAVQMTSGGNTGVTVQNGQATPNDWKTVLASSSAQSAPYVSLYNTPHLDYGSGASGGDDGVQGIPTAIGMVVNQSLPSAIGGGTTTNFNMTTENLSGAGSGLQVLWPFDSSGPTGDGCDSCTSMIEDFYIWPQYTASINPANVENWELDMNSWKLGDTYGYLGASFQCSILDGGWQYNGQSAPGWTNLSSTGFSSMTKINHDCQFPFGTLSADITSGTQQNFSVTPNVTGSVTAATVEPGMIVLLDNEEILCTASSGNTCTASQRGWAGTTAVTHAAGALYSGSVHVQYHVTFKPGDTSVCMINGKSGTAVECVFIDYLVVNNVKYDFHSIYGTQTVGGVAGYSALTNPAYTYTYPVDRAFDQKQIDVKSGIGSTSSPAEVGEFIDMDNVTASFGVIGSQSYVVP